MPVALLLQKVLDTLRASAAALSPWTEIVTLEATIVERARSAFLMHWFGRRLPMEGLSLRARIVNIGELDRQFLAAQRSVPTSAGGPNLTEPLLGFAGMLAGMALSPAGAIAGASLLLRFSAFSVGVLVKAIVWLAAPFLLGLALVAAPRGTSILVIGGLTALGAAFALSAAVGEDRPLRAVFDVFGALARFMNAAVIFLDQLAGPRAEVRNPLLRRLLDLADRFAGLVSQLLGAVAVLVTRIGPVLEPVARTLVGLGRLAGTAVTALTTVVAGLLSRVDELTNGPLAVNPVVRRVTGVARQQIEKVTNLVAAQVDVLADAFATVGTTLGDRLSSYADTAGEFVVRLFTEHPTVGVLAAFGKQLTAIVTAFTATPKPPPKPGAGPSKLAPLLAALPAAPSVRPFPGLPRLPDTDLLRLGAIWLPPLNLESIDSAAGDPIRVEFEAPVELSEQARAVVARMRRRPSVFRPERRALSTELTGLAERLVLGSQELARFRQAFAVIVGRVLPPELRGTAIPTLVEPKELPVLDLPDSDELRPVVKRLRLHLPGADVNDVKRFTDLVTERIQRRSYRVAPASGGR
ncbi:hypothetical protein [Actinophytocola sp.]|uniref:hypothetical protein n=1 Tax=Actinophytocola sp. TaxID=1872138 RepID=UPI00389A5EB6